MENEHECKPCQIDHTPGLYPDAHCYNHYCQAFKKADIRHEDIGSQPAATPARLPDDADAVEARLAQADLMGALVNLYHAIKGEDCPRHLALGMATSAVSSLIRQRNEALDQCAELHAATASRDAEIASLRKQLTAKGKSPTTALLQKIIEICDAGSAQEFGDADERLRAIRRVIIGEAV